MWRSGKPNAHILAACFGLRALSVAGSRHIYRCVRWVTTMRSRVQTSWFPAMILRVRVAISPALCTLTRILNLHFHRMRHLCEPLHCFLDFMQSSSSREVSAVYEHVAIRDIDICAQMCVRQTHKSGPAACSGMFWHISPGVVGVDMRSCGVNVIMGLLRRGHCYGIKRTTWVW